MYEREPCGADLQAFDGSEVGSEVRGKHSGQGVHIGGSDLGEDLPPMQPQEGHQVFATQQHILLQNLHAHSNLSSSRCSAISVLTLGMSPQGWCTAEACVGG